MPGVEGIVVNSRDLSERKTLKEQISHQAFHDSLTGLPNRARSFWTGCSTRSPA